MTETKKTVEQAQSELAQLCKLAASENLLVIIAPEEGDEVALVSVKELRSLQETAYLLSSPENAARLLLSLKQSQHGQLKPQTADELFEELESENNLKIRVLEALKQSQDGELQAQTVNELVELLENNLQVRLYSCLGAAQLGELEPEVVDELIKDLEKDL